MSPSHTILIPEYFIYHMPESAEEPSERLCVSALKTVALRKRQPVLVYFEQPGIVS